MASICLVSVTLATGCASFPPPVESLASARASVRGAEELGAADVPRAALQLQVAREEIVDAELLMEDGDNQLADARARRASEDADLAIALVREDQARTTAITAKARVHAAEAAEVSP